MQSDWDRIHSIVSNVCLQQQIELVEIVHKGQPPSQSIQIFIDRETGVTLNDCTMLSRRLAEIFDEELPEMQGYRLEVSSPGIDRPLKTGKDFIRNLGRRVVVQLVPGHALKRIKGDIAEADDETVTIDTGKEEVKIEYALIKLAKVQIKFN